jgi:hypothetical protein
MKVGRTDLWPDLPEPSTGRPPKPILGEEPIQIGDDACPHRHRHLRRECRLFRNSRRNRSWSRAIWPLPFRRLRLWRIPIALNPWAYSRSKTRSLSPLSLWIGFKTFAMVCNPVEAAKYSAQIMGTSEEIDKIIAPPPPPMMGPGGPIGGLAGAPLPPGAPGLKGGPNGNQPSFLPPEMANPLRRQPVAP